MPDLYDTTNTATIIPTPLETPEPPDHRFVEIRWLLPQYMYRALGALHSKLKGQPQVPDSLEDFGVSVLSAGMRLAMAMVAAQESSSRRIVTPEEARTGQVEIALG